jgi:CBS domain-containing protein
MVQHVEDVMTRDIETVTPDTSLRDAADKMRTLNVGPLPVVDENGLAGIITDRDIVVRAVAMGMDPNSSRVSDAMTSDVECVFQDEDINVALRKMQEEQIRRILVVERNTRKLVGILALGDIATTLDQKMAGKTLENISEPSQPSTH